MRIKTLVAALAAMLLPLSACATGETAKTTDMKTVTETANPEPAISGDEVGDDFESEEESGPPPLHHLVKSDVKLTSRITSKQCFGSAGCNVEVAVSLGWAIPDPGKLDGTYDVTYRLTGDESGVYIDSLTVYPNGKYDIPAYDASLSTASAATPIRVVVSRVDKVA